MIGGIDEAGRGPAIGPLVMALVVPAKSSFYQLPLKDSKLLKREEREELFWEIVERAHVEWAFASPQWIDRENLNRVEFSLMERLLEGKVLKELRVDAVGKSRAPLFLFSYAERVVYREKADRLFPEVAAAGIVAKVVRDEAMSVLGEKYQHLGRVGSGYLSDRDSRVFAEKHKELDIVRKKWLRNGEGEQR